MTPSALGSPARLWWGAVMLALVACSGGWGGDSGNPMGPSPMGPGGPSGGPVTGPAFPQVWSINAFDGQSYEFKTNCVGEFVELETCFLWDVTAVLVEAPGGLRFELDKDFNINAYSGEVTRRWVLYGPTGGGLPVAGNYRFVYYRGAEVALTQTVSYAPAVVGYPRNLIWRREGNDLVVDWTPPAGAQAGMWYKVLLFPPNNGAVISNTFEWNASSARLPNIPLADGVEATLNVAIYFDDGFSPSEYLSLSW